MGFDRSHFFARVVVEHAEVEVVGTADEPVASFYETHTADRDFGDFEGFYYGLSGVGGEWWEVGERGGGWMRGGRW